MNWAVFGFMLLAIMGMAMLVFVVWDAATNVEREACAKICDERKKAFEELLKKYGNESDAGAVLGAGQCGDLIRARGQQ